MGDRRAPEHRDRNIEEVLRYWHPDHDPNGDMDAQLIALFPAGMVHVDELDHHMAFALFMLAEEQDPDYPLTYVLRVLEYLRLKRYENNPGNEPVHLTQDEFEGAVVHIDILKLVKTKWSIDKAEDIFELGMRPESEAQEFMPWVTPLIPLLGAMCKLVDEGITSQYISGVVEDKWRSKPELSYEGADGTVRLAHVQPDEIDSALEELYKIHEKEKPQYLAGLSNGSAQQDFRRKHPKITYYPEHSRFQETSSTSQKSGEAHEKERRRSSEQTPRPATGGDALDSAQYEQDHDDIIANSWDDDTTVVNSASAGHVPDDEGTEDGPQDKTSPLLQQHSHYSVPSHMSDNGSEMSHYDPYQLINPDVGEHVETPRSLLRQLNNNIITSSSKASENERYRSPTLFYGGRFQAPIQNVTNEIESLHSTPQWMRDRDATRMRRHNAPGEVQARQLRDSSNNNEQLPQDSSINGAPASLGNMNQPRPVAGEVDMYNMRMGRQRLIQQGPVQLAAEPAAPTAPSRKAKSRQASRRASRYRPYSRVGRGRPRHRSRSSDGEFENEPEDDSMNEAVAEIAQGVTIDVFGRFQIPDHLTPERKLQLIAKQKSMLLRTRNIYQLGKEKYEAEELSGQRKFLSAQRTEYSEGLLEGLEFDEMLVTFEKDDA